MEPIRRTRGKYEEVVIVVEEIKKIGVKILKGNKWYIEREFMLKEGKVYVLRNEELRIDYIIMC